MFGIDDLALGAVISGGISAGAGIFGGERANAASAKSAKEQMDFQERMRNTSYQTAVTDMKAAGLNPAMMYNSGAGPAPVPVGAKYEAKNTMADVGKSITSAMELNNVSAQKDVLTSQANLNRANTAKAMAETTNLGEQVPGIRAHNELTGGQVREVEANISATLAKTDLTKVEQAKVSSEYDKIQEEIKIARSNATSADAMARIHSAEALASDTIANINSSEFGRALVVFDRIVRSLTPFK